MMIGYSGVFQRLPEGRLVELRVAARAGERPDIDKRFDSVGAQQADEGRYRMA